MRCRFDIVFKTVARHSLCFAASHSPKRHVKTLPNLLSIKITAHLLYNITERDHWLM
jgi:hypothetical protein